ncbi:MAG: hypothetical protein HC790_01700 [Acaryochloridaceae cyanobacterium CSU_3_4]|nr:hypothetical protein [Acaryochloridaceae cyanobacterium CSU_3_4]
MHLPWLRRFKVAFRWESLIQLCHNRRIKRHKVFKGIAARGKTSNATVSDQGSVLAGGKDRTHFCTENPCVIFMRLRKFGDPHFLSHKSRIYTLN